MQHTKHCVSRRSVANEAKTTGLVDASAAATITGYQSDLFTAVQSRGIHLSGTEAITDTSIGSAETPVGANGLNTLDAATSGLVTATAATVISGTTAAITSAVTSSGILLSHTETLTLTDAASIAQLTALSDATTGTVGYTSITDTAADLATLDPTTGIWAVNRYITSGTNVTVSGTMGASELAAIDAANGSGTVTVADTLLSAPNAYLIETASSSALTVSNNVIARETQIYSLNLPTCSGG